MKFFVYHGFTLGLINMLCHNISNRKIDDTNKKVTGKYNQVDVTFYFDFSKENYPELTDNDLSYGYHIILREEAIKNRFFIQNLGEYQNKLGFPDCLHSEYKSLDSNIEFHVYNWILFWNFGENKFIHLGIENLDKNEEFLKLKKIVNNTIFFSDNYVHEHTPYASINAEKLLKSLTNDVFMWNYYAQITWANEFKNVFKHLNPPNKLCVSFRSPKPHRIEICKKLGNKNLEGVYISYSSSFFEKRKGQKDPSWKEMEYDKVYDTLSNIKNLNINKIGKYSDCDFENLEAAGNSSSYMEFDYYFRILHQAKIQLLDETHSYLEYNDSTTPINLSEKTYILLLANIPFISTHHYPIDLIQEHILNLEHPYYMEIKNASISVDNLVKFIEKLIDNFDEMYPKIKEWTNLVHMELQRRIRTENSFLEHMTTKI